MPIPTSTHEQALTDKIRRLERTKATLVVTAVTAASLALVLPCPIHTY